MLQITYSDGMICFETEQHICKPYIGRQIVRDIK